MASTSTKRDPSTSANYNEFRCKHIATDFELDFKKKGLRGRVDLTLERLGESNEVVLDTSFLNVHDVKNGDQSLKWELGERQEPLGSPLKIRLDGSATNKSVVISIDVETTEKCSALQWFAPEQTSNKKHPYMFSQCQATHARSIFPCQDTPDVKATVEYRIRSPLPVLTSGLSTGVEEYRPGVSGEPGTLLYTFAQKNPIPSYLFSIASGDIAMASIGSRSQVATGPEELAAAKWELENDMEKFLAAAEKLLHPVNYQWTTYNVLVLPPSFPFGGMENPVFTFATPAIISGDRENIDVIAHELAHSWSGNLVSNGSWEHFWLNEGWTVYIERRIMAELHGEAQRHFSAIIGWKQLTDSIQQFGEEHEFTKLVPNLKGRDIDDAFSSIPYEKGFTFLFYLENLVGKGAFDHFIPHYFSTFAWKSLDSFEFRKCLLDFFASDAAASKQLATVDWDTWFYKAGFPPKPNFDTTLADECFALATKWAERAQGKGTFEPAPTDIAAWSASQKMVFLEQCEEAKPPLRAQDTQHMAEVYGLLHSQNLDLTSRMFRLGLLVGDKSAIPPTLDLLGRVGRMKYVRPLYRALHSIDPALAKETFLKNESFYHPICREMARKDVGA